MKFFGALPCSFAHGVSEAAFHPSSRDEQVTAKTTRTAPKPQIITTSPFTEQVYWTPVSSFTFIQPPKSDTSQKQGR